MGSGATGDASGNKGTACMSHGDRQRATPT
jgi:hypothetical protein